MQILTPLIHLKHCNETVLFYWHPILFFYHCFCSKNSICWQWGIWKWKDTLIFLTINQHTSLPYCILYPLFCLRPFWSCFGELWVFKFTFITHQNGLKTARNTKRGHTIQQGNELFYFIVKISRYLPITLIPFFPILTFIITYSNNATICCTARVMFRIFRKQLVCNIVRTLVAFHSTFCLKKDQKENK